MPYTEELRTFYPEDILAYASKLTEGEFGVLKSLREQLETKVRPHLIEYTEKGQLPKEQIVDAFKTARIMDHPDLFNEREESLKASEIYNAFLYLELARFDPSVATYYTVHGGLGYNTILVGGNEEQIQRFAVPVRQFDALTCFGLTEPDHGSDIAGGLATTAERQGDKWLLNGEKRWIGGAKTSDFVPIFARDVASKEIKCFMVPVDARGFEVEDIQHKVSLRMVNNGHITMTNVEVAEADRLEHINGFVDVAKILVYTRADVAHIAMGTAAGAFNAALKYTKSREQFGRPLAKFQLVQDKLSTMQANVVAAIGYSVRLAELQEINEEKMLNSSLAKFHNSRVMRETVALAREVCGGNGITLESDVARFFVDAEAIYTYEGTNEVNSLIIGREITGEGAFV